VRWTALRGDALSATAFGGPTLRPVSYLSFGLSYLLGGPDPAGFRLLNVLIHAANAILVALLGRALLARLPQPPPPRDALWIAWLAGLVFAVHPLATQSVTYVVQRMTSLAALFYLAALLAWLRGRESVDPGQRAAWWTAAGASGLLALGSKEIAITLPAAIWLVEWFFFRDLDPGFARKSALRLGLPALVAGVVAYAAIFHGSGYAGRPFGAGERLLTELRVVVFYASLVVWPLPSRLNLLHDVALSRSLLDPPGTLLAAGLLLAAGVLAGLGARRAPLVAFALAWFGLHLTLESFVLPLALVYEHRVYLPLVAAAWLAPWALFAATGMRARRAVPLALLGVALLAGATLARNQVWRDELGFWREVAARSPGLAGARNNLGLALQRAGELEAAIAEYRAALELDPLDAGIHVNLGSAWLALGRRVEAVSHFEAALRISPDDYRAHYNLGHALAVSGQVDAGASHLERAAHLAPWDAAVWNGLGAVRDLQGRLDEAAEALARALRLDPGNAEAAHNLAAVRARLATREPD
jgi:tetratricopeptide (TPR) repeat protein